MTDLTRTQLLDTLNDGWATYVARYHALPAGDREQWLAAQGYTRFADLLAHVVAWWVDSQQVIERVAADPDYPLRDYDVDVFNAEAVAQYAALDEDCHDRRLRASAGRLDSAYQRAFGCGAAESEDRRPVTARDPRAPGGACAAEPVKVRQR